MNSQLFIPKKCKVGFNLREDTYTGKLGYIIAYDGKKWRKEYSWNNWIQKPGQKVFVGWGKNLDGTPNYQRIEKELGNEVLPIEFDNVPTSGFILNKKVGGYKSDWNMRQTYARVYDPRGFEFEINIVNLLYILETCNCLRGKGLEGDFVYSWDGKDLVLLPCSSWEYEKANNYTNLQNQKISAKNLILGGSYKTKKEKDVVYIGRYFWYEINLYGRSENKSRTGKKYHIFTSDDGKSFDLKSNVDFLAQQNSVEPVSNYADIIENFQKNTHSSKIVKFETVPCEFDLTTDSKYNYYDRGGLKKSKYFSIQDNILNEYLVCIQRDKDKNILGYLYSVQLKFNVVTQEIIESNYYYGDIWIHPNGRSYSHRWGHSNDRSYWTEEQIKQIAQEHNFSDLTITFESGKKIKIDNQQNIYNI